MISFFCNNNVKVFGDIGKEGAFFIIRVKTNTVFYVKNPQKANKYIKIDITKELTMYGKKQ